MQKYITSKGRPDGNDHDKKTGEKTISSKKMEKSGREVAERHVSGGRGKTLRRKKHP